MKNLFILFASVILSFYVGATKSLAQSGGKVVGEITITVDKRISTVPVVQNPRFLHYETVLGIDSSDYVCNLFLGASAIEKKNEALVIFRISTQDGKKEQTSSKKVELKKNETKSFKLKTNLKCLNFEYFAATANYKAKD